MKKILLYLLAILPFLSCCAQSSNDKELITTYIQNKYPGAEITEIGEIDSLEVPHEAVWFSREYSSLELELSKASVKVVKKWIGNFGDKYLKECGKLCDEYEAKKKKYDDNFKICQKLVEDPYNFVNGTNKTDIGRVIKYKYFGKVVTDVIVYTLSGTEISGTYTFYKKSMEEDEQYKEKMENTLYKIRNDIWE